MTREEAIKKLLEENCGYGDGDCDRCKFKCEIYMAIEALRQVEELEAEIDVLNWTIEKLSKKRPKGRWIQEIHTGLIGETNEYNDTYFFRCSICGRTVFEKEPYCHCGADMRDGEEE